MAEPTNRSLGFVLLEDGSTPGVASRPADRFAPTEAPSGVTESSESLIYTDAQDAPSLEALLERFKVQYAVLESSAPAIASIPARTAPLLAESRPIRARDRSLDAVIGAVLATVFLAVGLGLLVTLIIAVRDWSGRVG